ncbi:MAG: protein TolR [Ottowia sp.]|nr:MAG: protein TolR [Ottowia sp.]
MSMMTRHKRRKLKSEINVVPYIDVMLVLLIIFMVTAPLLSLSVDVDLPKSQARAVDSRKDPVIVTVDAEGRYFLTVQGGKAEGIDATELTARLQAFVGQNPDTPVFVAAAKTVEYEKVFDTMALIQAADVSKVSLMGQPKDQAK